MDQGFPWVLAAKYLMSGAGCVVGILSAAMASFAMRELKDSTSPEKIPMRKSSNLSSQVEFRKSSHPAVILEEPTHIHIIDEQKEPILQRLASITERTSNGVMETSFP